jgi:CBS-domain-containing membrane protein
MQIFISKMPIRKLGGEVRQHLQRLRARSAKELMTHEVITVMDKMPVASALALSAEKRVKRLPVVDADGELVGIVGRTELMRALLA